MPDTEKDCDRLQKALKKDIETAKDTTLKNLLDPKLYRISAVTGLGVHELNMAIANKVKALKQARAQEAENKSNYEKI